MHENNSTETLSRGNPGPRFWEIDCLRTLAIGGMIFFHFCFIFNDLGLINLPIHTGFWWIFPRIDAATFITLMGACLTISYNKTKLKYSPKKTALKFLRRGATLITIALVITLITWFIFKENLVLFGILHFIGLSIILAYPLLRFKYSLLLAGCFILAGGLLLGTVTFGFSGLLWLGFRPAGYYPVDYLPLLPWFAFTCWGIFLGNWLYPCGRRRLNLPELACHPLIRILGFPGRHSLKIYLAHLPLLYGLGLLITLINTG